MKQGVQTFFHTAEGVIGFEVVPRLLNYVPLPVQVRKYQNLILGGAIVMGGLVIKDKKVASHVLAFGFGTALGGVLDVFGLKR